MIDSTAKARTNLYLGVDVGGTKIQGSLVCESGSILGRERCASPRNCPPEKVVATIEQVVRDLLAKKEYSLDDLSAVGVAVPGVVDPDAGRVVVTPNMSLSGVELVRHLEDQFQKPVALGNDCNLGALGERWLGSARGANSAFAILVGTGIGGGFVQKGRLWRGARESASEIGHIVMQIDGPQCGCGNFGCLEALASRTAIERDLREAINSGRQSVLPELLEGDLSIIRSGAIRRALEADDALVTEVMRRASETLGFACLTVRHLLDPEVIVLGGGVVEACSDFMMPIVENVVGSDQLPGSRESGRVLLSALGDDAVVLGAVALARVHAGRSPFKDRYAITPEYPRITGSEFGAVTVRDKTYHRDIYIRVNGKVKQRKKRVAKEEHGTSHVIGTKELERVCKGGPEILFVGTGISGQVALSDEARRYLEQRSIGLEALPTPQAVDAYNNSTQRKAALIHVTC